MGNYRSGSDTAQYHKCGQCGQHTYRKNWAGNNPIVLSILTSIVLLPIGTVIGSFLGTDIILYIVLVIISLILIGGVKSQVEKYQQGYVVFKCDKCNYENKEKLT